MLMLGWIVANETIDTSPLKIMLTWPKTKKTAGILVSADVHRLISRGNRARDEHKFNDAATLYRSALDSEPGLRHIWIQLAHALKEQNRLADAEAAYRHAIEIDPADADPYVHLAHLYRKMNRIADSVRMFIEVLQRVPDHADAMHYVTPLLKQKSDVTLGDSLLQARGWRENDAAPAGSRFQDTVETCLQTLVRVERAPASAHERELLSKAADLIRSMKNDLEKDPAAKGGQAFVDVTFILDGWQGFSKASVDQYWQLSLLKELTYLSHFRLIACYLDETSGWKSIPWPNLLKLGALSTKADNKAEWDREMLSLNLHGLSSPSFAFQENKVLVIIGSDRRDRYLPYLRNIQDQYCLELLNILTPEDVSPAKSDAAPSSAGVDWVRDIAALGGRTLIGSEQIDAALQDIAGSVNADVHAIGDALLPAGEAIGHPLASEPYMLCVVSSASAREGLFLLELWRALADRMASQTPQLIVVSMVEDIETRLGMMVESDLYRNRQIQIASRVSAEELYNLHTNAMLVFQTCLGASTAHWLRWGLAAGKVSLALDPQFEGGDLEQLITKPEAATLSAAIETLEKLVRNPDHRLTLEKRNGSGYAPGNMALAVGQIDRHLRELTDRVHIRPGVAEALTGRWYAFGDDNAAGASQFKWGPGWGRVDHHGAAIRAGGARLRLTPSERLSQGYTLYVQLICPADTTAHFEVSLDTGAMRHGAISPHSTRWLVFHIAGDEVGEYLELKLSETARRHQRRNPGDPVSEIAVAGFCLVDPLDLHAKSVRLEAIAFGGEALP